VKALFQRYAASLDVTLDYQDFAGELADFPHTYAPPGGALFIARSVDDTPVGCVGLKPLSDSACEMKRLYLEPAARGQGVGQALAEAVIAAARARGYSELKLDTLGHMHAAIALYEKLGFLRTAAYYRPTPEGTIFMHLIL
jgi:ribosomal protein S18 acetylase RimI-like enzyme